MGRVQILLGAAGRQTKTCTMTNDSAGHHRTAIVFRGALATLAAAVALSACGGSSKEDKANATVCSAKSDIAAQLSDLQSLAPTAASLPMATTQVAAIGDDVKKIKSSETDLGTDQKQAAQQATQRFGASSSAALASLLITLRTHPAKAEISTVGTQLQTAFEQDFAPVKCDS